MLKEVETSMNPSAKLSVHFNTASTLTAVMPANGSGLWPALSFAYRLISHNDCLAIARPLLLIPADLPRFHPGDGPGAVPAAAGRLGGRHRRHRAIDQGDR